MSVGKALGSGVPVAAALVSERVSKAISAGDHGSTYGGNLLACRAAAFFLEQLMDKGLLEHVREAGAHFERRLRTMALRHPVIVEARGAGLMRGLELRIDATVVVDQARERSCWSTGRPTRGAPRRRSRRGADRHAVEILYGVLTAVRLSSRLTSPSNRPPAASREPHGFRSASLPAYQAKQ